MEKDLKFIIWNVGKSGSLKPRSKKVKTGAVGIQVKWSGD
jgi:hypothetical protein